MYVDVEIDPDDFLSSASSKDKQYIVDSLYDEGFVPEQSIEHYESNPNVHDEFWSEAINKLHRNRLSLSNYEIELIENITKKLP